MPTYEYRCKDCAHELEVQQSFSDDPLTECPSCGGALKKKFSSVGISFKGSGFYKTDSRRSTPSGTKEPAKESTGAESSGSTADSTPSTATPAKASEGSTASSPAATPSKPAAATPA
jgi:putative FmdB family regulatory protein